jgi:hypothetical protein
MKTATVARFYAENSGHKKIKQKTVPLITQIAAKRVKEIEYILYQ